MESLYIYIRVSSKGQTDGGSLETQESIGKKVAKKLGLKPIVLNEGGKSSTLGYRDVLEDEIKVGIEQRKIRHLWVLDRSRLFRNSPDSQYFRKQYLEEFGCKFYEGEYGNEVTFDSPDETLAYDLISRIQQSFVEKSSAKSKYGKRNLLKKKVHNKHYGGTVLFGYGSKDGYLFVDKEESKWVLQMFNSVAKGLSTMEIKKELDRNGVKPRRGKTWSLGSIQVVLKNRAYIGEKDFKDKELKRKGLDYHFKYSIDPIVKRTIFFKVQKILNARANPKDNNKKHFSLFSDYMTCECGISIGSVVKQGKRKTGESYNTRQYYCNSRSQLWKKQIKSQCKNVKSMQMDRTDEFLISEIKKIVEDSNLLKEKFKTDVLHTKFSDIDDMKVTEKKLEEKAKRINKRMGSTMDNIISLETDIIQGRTKESIGRRIVSNLNSESEALQKELLKVEEEIRTLSSKKEWLDWVKKYGESLRIESKANEKKKEWVKGLVSKIIVHSHYGDNRDKKNVQIGHSFDIHFKMKIVKDKLVWNDDSNKRKGYQVIEGKKIYKADEVNFNYVRTKKKAVK